MQRLNGREVFSGILLLFISSVYLFILLNEWFTTYGDAWRAIKGMIQVNTEELKMTIRRLFVIVLGITGGILLLRLRRTGWIISFPTLTFHTALALYLFINSFVLLTIDLLFMFICVGILLLLLATLFLLLPSTLKKFRVGKRTILPTLVLFMALIAVTFFL